MAVITGRVFGSELVKLWGLEHCRNIKIDIPSNGLVIITAEFNAQKEDMEKVEQIFKKYQLKEIPVVNEKQEQSDRENYKE
jgi:hypothetical protein